MFRKHFFNFCLKIGVVGALGFIAYFFVFYALGVEACAKVYMNDFWIPSIFVILSLKFYRDKMNAGELRFWEGLSLGTFVVFWIVFIAAIIIFLFVKFVDYSFFEQCIDSFRAYNLSIKKDVIDAHGKDAYEVATNEIEQISLIGIVVKKFLLDFFISLISVVIFSVFFRR